MPTGAHEFERQAAVRTSVALADPEHRAEGPEPGRARSLLGLQRLVGNRTVASLVRSGVMASAVQRYKSKDSDFNNQQYRVSQSGGERLIEVVERRERGDGTPYYLAIGKVVQFERNHPIVEPYAEPRNLGDWAPRVTHINGMGVTPQSGLASAKALFESVNAKIQSAGDDVAVEQGAIDVLFTYSAKRGNFASDVFNCIKGKVGVEDSVTRSQEQTMLDAIAAKRRIHVSAHSRGTIKTDNAVRTVFKTLSERYKVEMRADPQVLRDARQRARDIYASGLMDMETAKLIAVEQTAAYVGEQRAKAEMDKFIQLVYGGNAVSYPSSVIPVELFVGSMDFVSLGVGTYTKAGAKWASGNDRSVLHKQGGGHGYTENYAKPVGEAIGADILKEQE